MNEKEKFYKLCEVACRFYKPEKKAREHCFGFDKVIELIKSGKLELPKILSINFTNFKNVNDKLLQKALCTPCPFLIDGCDFRMGKGKEPCGGYKILDLMIEEKIIDRKSL